MDLATVTPAQPSGHAADDLASTAMHVRQELARELHDRVAQTLTAMLVEMENFKALEFARERVIHEVTGYQDATREALSNIREILYELRGDEEDLGSEFVARVRRLLERFEEKTGISASLSVSASWPSRLAVQAAVNLYRVLEEALNNVRMHSGANAVAVSFQMEEGDLAVVSVTDDGVGLGPLMGERTGLGMLGMRERALLLGGELSIEPVRPHGMALTAVIPKERLL
jgi:two-component system sensor histidine kinase UhpB